MIEVDTVVQCNSKEKANLEKFKRLQNITYITNVTIERGSSKDYFTGKPCKYGEDCKLKSTTCRYTHPIKVSANKAALERKMISILYGD
jgi:hypothetical protein